MQCLVTNVALQRVDMGMHPGGLAAAMLGGGGGWLHVQLQGLRLPVHPQAALEVPPAAEPARLCTQAFQSVVCADAP